MQTEQVFVMDVQQQQHLGNRRSTASEGHLAGASRFGSQRATAHQPARHAAIGSRGEFGMFMIQD